MKVWFVGTHAAVAMGRGSVFSLEKLDRGLTLRFHLPSLPLTWQLKGGPFKRTFIFQVPPHRCHVSWRKGILCHSKWVCMVDCFPWKVEAMGQHQMASVCVCWCPRRGPQHGLPFSTVAGQLSIPLALRQCSRDLARGRRPPRRTSRRSAQNRWGRGGLDELLRHGPSHFSSAHSGIGSK